MKKGDKIKFEEEKQLYTVRSVNNRFAICTKPFNLKKTVIYTIIDFKKQVRGTENLIFSQGAETDQQCRRMLKRLTKGETEISHRNNIPLNIENIKPQDNHLNIK